MIALAAMASNRVIGKNGKLAWPRIEADMQFLKAFTFGNQIVMGRKTFEGVGVLPNCKIFVLTTKPTAKIKKLHKEKKIKIIKKLKQIPEESIIFGGADIYEQTLSFCTDLYLTFIDKEFEGDTYFPYFEDEFELEDSIDEITEDGICLEFRHYVNKLFKQ